MLFKLIIKLLTPPPSTQRISLYYCFSNLFVFPVQPRPPPSPRAPVLKEVGRGAEQEISRGGTECQFEGPWPPRTPKKQIILEYQPPRLPPFLRLWTQVPISKIKLTYLRHFFSTTSSNPEIEFKRVQKLQWIRFYVKAWDCDL